MRFWSALTVGIATFFCLPESWTFISRILVSWDGGVTLFLLAIYLWMTRLTADQIQSRYMEEDPSGPVILVFVIIAALLSVLAIVEPLATLRHVPHSIRIWRVALAAVTLVDSWLLVPTMFTTRRILVCVVDTSAVWFAAEIVIAKYAKSQKVGISVLGNTSGRSSGGAL